LALCRSVWERGSGSEAQDWRQRFESSLDAFEGSYAAMAQRYYFVFVSGEGSGSLVSLAELGSSVGGGCMQRMQRVG